MALAQKVLIGNVYYSLSSSDNTAAVCAQSYDSASNYAGVTNLYVPPIVVYQGTRYTVTSVSDRAFANCASLAAITLPNSLQRIDDYAFSGCAALVSVAIPNGVTSLGTGAFYNCRSIAYIRVPNGVTCIEPYTFMGCAGLLSVFLPATVTEIRAMAFSGCATLASIALPNALTAIPKEAFKGCAALQSIAIPNKVVFIADGAFADCTSLAAVRMSNSVTDLGEGVFVGCTALTRPVYNAHLFMYMPASFHGYFAIPNGIEAIMEGAFAGCAGLTNISIPASVTYIDDEAFIDCVNLPVFEGIRYADTYLVSVVDRYQPSYTVRPGTRWIAESAFAQMNWLQTVVLPASLTSVGEEAFRQCKNLRAIYNYADDPQDITWDVFAGPTEWKEGESYGPVDKSTCVLYVPYESVSKYQSAPVWSEFAHIQPIDAPETIDNVNADANAVKSILDGRLIIRRGDNAYTPTGIQINK